MSYNYTLRYRTFDALLADAASDFKKYQLSSLIDPQDMIKVAKRVNYDLGLRVQQTREVVLEVEKGRVKLPNDFYTLNFAMMCGKYETKQYLPQGTHIEDKIIDPVKPAYEQAPPPVTLDCATTPAVTPCDPCNTCGTPCCDDTCGTCNTSPTETAVENSCTLNCKGETVQLVQKLSYQTRTYSVMKPIRLLENAMSIECDCPNLYWESPFTGWIKDGWLYVNFQSGSVYLNYQGMMVNEDGDLIVVDHDMINEYYEYALKQRILENLIMNDEVVSQGKIQMIEQRYRTARINALSIVRTPNFSELKKIWTMNRNAQYNRYYDMFSSYPRKSVANSRGIWRNQ